MPSVVFVMGSDSDLPQLEGAFALLGDFDVSFGVRVLSAHRTPRETAAFADAAEADGVQVIVAAAGMAAALAGFLAGHSNLPVIGIPMEGSALGGVDALYATVQMPGGVPVACMGIGSHGAKNAALFAVRILALSDEGLRKKLHGFVEQQAAKVRGKDEAARKHYGA